MSLSLLILQKQRFKKYWLLKNKNLTENVSNELTNRHYKMFLKIIFDSRLKTNSQIRHTICQLHITLTDRNIALWKNNLYLTTHNWHDWKRVFLPCYCHEIYRGEAVYKNHTFCEYKNWGNFLKNLYFVNNCLIKVRI